MHLRGGERQQLLVDTTNIVAAPYLTALDGLAHVVGTVDRDVCSWQRDGLTTFRGLVNDAYCGGRGGGVCRWWQSSWGKGNLVSCMKMVHSLQLAAYMVARLSAICNLRVNATTEKYPIVSTLTHDASQKNTRHIHAHTNNTLQNKAACAIYIHTYHTSVRTVHIIRTLIQPRTQPTSFLPVVSLIASLCSLRIGDSFSASSLQRSITIDKETVEESPEFKSIQ